MSSTYSTNLRLELIAPGEQANTWGNTTNNNLGTLIEQSITGITTIDISAGNVTLTSLNGAFDQARSMIIDVAGAAGSARTVFTPANVAKVYIVNNTTNADVIMSTLAAGTPTTVTVVAGASMLVFTDGTDFFEGSNSANVFTADTVTITGTPSVSTDAVTFGYVGTTFYPKTGGTVNGPITSTGDISVAGSGAVLRFADGTTQSTAAAASSPSVPSGSVMLFYNASAPVGWTQNITQNDKALRVVSGSGGGSGGSVAFSTAFASQPVTGSVSLAGLSTTVSISGTTGGRTITEGQMPSHRHAIGYGVMITDSGNVGWVAGSNMRGTAVDTTFTGGSSSHDHSFSGSGSGSVSGSATFTGTAINLAVQYLDMILCTKN